MNVEMEMRMATRGRAGRERRDNPWPVLLVLFLFPFLSLSICAQDKSASLRTRQRAQQQARVMAKELVSGVLDVQLRQLQENNLMHLPVYADIQSMRGNLEELIEKEMQDVVQLLEGAQGASETKRQEVLVQARSKIREVVVALMAQRQKLHKRMQLAKIAAQTRQLILMESKVIDITRSLPEEDRRDREELTLSTLDDQRDVTALYDVLLGILDDVGRWEGPIGAGASKGLRLLKTLRVDVELAAAEESLAASRYSEAERAELAVIKGLRALLEIIEQAQGLDRSDRGSVAELAQQLRQDQEQLREQTKSSDLNDMKRAEELAQQQHDIHQRLGDLAEALQPFATAEPLADQARAAAYEAESKLFEGDSEKAMHEQGVVVGALAEIEKRLEQAAESTSDVTAEQLAQRVEQLEKLDQALNEIRTTQGEVAKSAAADAPGAKAKEDQVAQKMAQANQQFDLGAAIETRLADAQDAVSAAQQILQNAAPDMANSRSEAAQEALRAIEHAATEVKHELADSRREHLAVKVGELARAAEALERAAAAERQVARTARDAARAEGLAPDEAQRLATEQQRVNTVARDISEGVKTTAPQAAKQLQDAQPVLDTAAQQIQSALQNPGEASKPVADQLAQSAAQASRSLEQAAAALRKETEDAAGKLAEIAQRQLEPLVAARDSVEHAQAALESSESPADALAELNRALDQTRQAQVAQLRAAGQEAAADSQELLNEIAALAGQQAEADRAAQELVLGRTSSPLAASAAEQQLAESARKLAERVSSSKTKSNSPDAPTAPPAADLNAPVAQELRLAARQAAEAAKEQVIGNPNKANAARQEVRNALGRAREAASRAAAEAAKMPASEPDRESQQRVSTLAEQAKKDAESASPQAAESLAEARKSSQAAEQSLDAKEPEPAAEQQMKTSEALARSADQLQQSIQALAKKQAEAAGQFAQGARKLANEALPVDAGAAVALQLAESAAARSAANSEMGDPAGDAQQAFEQGLQRAEASMAAREDELRRDASIAAAIAQLAKDQQAAREQIAQQSAKLEKLAEARPPEAKPVNEKPANEKPANEKEPPATPAPSAEEVAAAQSLAEAVQQFGDAQRATGEGAAEISGQEQVANQPIRHGLETASQLGMAAPPSRDLPQGQAPTATEPAAKEAASPSATASNEAPPNSANAPGKDDLARKGDAGKGDAGKGDAGNEKEALAQGDPSESKELGTGFVPKSPEFTARQIAGEKAWNEVAKALANRPPAQGEASASEPAGEAGDSAKAEQLTKTESTAMTKKGSGAVDSRKAGQNQDLADQPAEQLANGEKKDSRSQEPNDTQEVAARRFDDEPWFARLPPSLQNAIHTRARRDAPRGYEERLKRYFESKD